MTIQRRINQHIVYFEKQEPRKVIVLYRNNIIGINFRIMLFKDNITKENL
jgi:hypothetical protein